MAWKRKSRPSFDGQGEQMCSSCEKWKPNTTDYFSRWKNRFFLSTLCHQCKYDRMLKDALKRDAWRPKEGVIYFVYLEFINRPPEIKIGHTAKLEQRMKYWNGIGGRLLGVMEGTTSDEKTVHWLFNHLMTGEWGTVHANEQFHIEDDLIDFVEWVAHPVNVKAIENITVAEIRGKLAA